MYIYYYIMSRQRSSLPLPVYSCPYHTMMNKSLVPEWPCIIEVSYIYTPTLTFFYSVSEGSAPHNLPAHSLRGLASWLEYSTQTVWEKYLTYGEITVHNCQSKHSMFWRTVY
jgi:hypothetical protein